MFYFVYLKSELCLSLSEKASAHKGLYAEIFLLSTSRKGDQIRKTNHKTCNFTSQIKETKIKLTKTVFVSLSNNHQFELNKHLTHRGEVRSVRAKNRPLKVT